MSKTQLGRIFVMMFRILYTIMLFSSRDVHDKKIANNLISEAQELMNEIAND